MRITPVFVAVLAALWCCLMSAATAQVTQLPGIPAETSPLPVEDTAPAPLPTGEGEDEVAPPPAEEAALPSQVRRADLMIKRGEAELEWRVSYSHFSSNTLFIDGVAMLPIMVIGNVAVERVRRDLIITSAAVRYGLQDNLEGEVRLPFRYQFERRAVPDASPPQEDTLNGFGLGDIEGALYYQLPKTPQSTVRWIVSAGVKTATGKDIFEIDTNEEVPLGSGFWSSKFGITGMKIADPAAIYWNAGFTYNWLRENIRIVSTDQTTGDTVVSYVNIKPGNTIDFGGGVAYALNPKLSLNMGVSASFSGSTTSNDRRVPNTAVTSATLRLGAVWVGEVLPVDLSLGIGLTEDSPDFTLEFRQNYRF